MLSGGGGIVTGNSQVDFARYTGSRKRAVGLLLIWSISFLVLENTRSTAQTASQTTPSNFEPAPQRAAEAIVFSDSAGLAPPPGAENLSILISGVQVDGTLSGMEQATGDFEGRVTRGRIPVSEVFEAAADLERAYIEAGFILARVVLPEQRLDELLRMKREAIGNA